jgi:hypothetical protein
VRRLACYEEILTKKKRYLSRKNSEHNFSKSSSGTPASPPVLLDTGYANPYDQPTVDEEAIPP